MCNIRINSYVGVICSFLILQTETAQPHYRILKFLIKVLFNKHQTLIAMFYYVLTLRRTFVSRGFYSSVSYVNVWFLCHLFPGIQSALIAQNTEKLNFIHFCFVKSYLLCKNFSKFERLVDV